MKNLAGIVLATLSMFGLNHQNTAVKAPPLAVSFPKPILLSAAAPIAPIAPIPKSSKPIVAVSRPLAAGAVLGTTTDGIVTPSQLQAAIEQASNSLRQLIYANAGSSIGVGQYSTGGFTNNIALSYKIDQLSDVTISGGSISNASLSGVTGLTTSDIGGFGYATSSNFVHIAAWGDSITSGYGGNNASWPTQLSLLTGYSVYNGGKGGDTSTQIAARFSAQPDKFSYPTIIWSGRNNYSDPTTVQTDIASMVASLATPNYFVLSILNGAGEGATTTAYSQIASLNNTLAATYGSHYLDIRAYLVSQYDPTNPTDVDNFNSDVPPSSLRYDFLHPNTTGYLKAAQYIQARLSLLGVTPGNTLLTTNNLAQFAVSPPTFGFVNSKTGYQQDGTTVLVASSTKFTTFVGLGVGTNSTASWNTAVGYQSLFSGTTASANDAFGFQSLYNNTTGANNSAYGVWSLFNNTTGGSNIAHGGQALFRNVTGSNNTAIGFGALDTNTTGGNNVALGYDASYYNNSATGTVAIGYNAALGNFSNYSAQGSVAVGYEAGKKFATGSDYNTVLGYSAGTNITTGAGNILIGAASSTANANLTTGYANISIGNNIKLPSATGSYQLDIGNLIYGTNLNGIGATLSTGNIGIGTVSPYSRLQITGTDSASSTSSFAVVSSASTTVFSVFNGGNAQLSGTLTQSSDQRLKSNIQILDASSSLASINALTPVAYDWLDPEKGGVRQYGFIAQQVQRVFPSLVSTSSATALTPDGTLGLNYLGLIAPIVEAVQILSTRLSSLEAMVSGFAESFASKKITASQELCIGVTCVTETQLQALLSGVPAVQLSAPTPFVISGTSTPPLISIQGSNPATINVGDTYTDLGALVTDNQGHDLSYRTFINGALSGNILIDTSQAATDTIDYVATDTWGNTATNTRMVIIEAVAADN